MIPKEKVCLVIIDGWGIREEKEGNAIYEAQTPTMDSLMSNSILLEASGSHVGLPDGQWGNCEVGHWNLGAGRIMENFMDDISESLKSGKFLDNPTFIDAVNRAKSVSNSRIHLFGLCSNGGAHSHIDHIFGILESCKKKGIKDCYLHFISDGRDTSPTSGVKFLKDTLDLMHALNYGRVATVVGKYYAMDNSVDWDRIQVAFDGFCHGKGTLSTEDSIIEDIEKSYAKGIKHTDEYLTPYILGGEECRVQDYDTLLFLNYKTHQTRMMVNAFGINPEFDSPFPTNLEVYCMFPHDNYHIFKTFFDLKIAKNSIAEWLSYHRVTSGFIPDGEKFSPVNISLNGGKYRAFDYHMLGMFNRDEVPAYDLRPSLHSEYVADSAIKDMKKGKYKFIALNLAPPDIIGHTGVYESTVKACVATDQAITRIYDACEKYDYVLMITSDHGKAEFMIDSEGKPFTANTLSPVPLIITKNYRLKYPSERKPALCDVATTILDVMGLPIPPEMTGISLLDHTFVREGWGQDKSCDCAILH